MSMMSLMVSIFKVNWRNPLIMKITWMVRKIHQMKSRLKKNSSTTKKIRPSHQIWRKDYSQQSDSIRNNHHHHSGSGS